MVAVDAVVDWETPGTAGQQVTPRVLRTSLPAEIHDGISWGC